MATNVYFKEDLANILASLYQPGNDAWNEVLIRVGRAFGLKPSDWVPGE